VGIPLYNRFMSNEVAPFVMDRSVSGSFPSWSSSTMLPAGSVDPCQQSASSSGPFLNIQGLDGLVEDHHHHHPLQGRYQSSDHSEGVSQQSYDMQLNNFAYGDPMNQFMPDYNPEGNGRLREMFKSSLRTLDAQMPYEGMQDFDIQDAQRKGGGMYHHPRLMSMPPEDAFYSAEMLHGGMASWQDPVAAANSYNSFNMGPVPLHRTDTHPPAYVMGFNDMVSGQPRPASHSYPASVDDKFVAASGVGALSMSANPGFASPLINTSQPGVAKTESAASLAFDLPQDPNFQHGLYDAQIPTH